MSSTTLPYLSDATNRQSSHENRTQRGLQLPHATAQTRVHIGNIWLDEGDIEHRREGVNELEDKRLGDQGILVLRVGTMVLEVIEGDGYGAIDHI